MTHHPEKRAREQNMAGVGQVQAVHGCAGRAYHAGEESLWNEHYAVFFGQGALHPAIAVAKRRQGGLNHRHAAVRTAREGHHLLQVLPEFGDAGSSQQIVSTDFEYHQRVVLVNAPGVVQCGFHLRAAEGIIPHLELGQVAKQIGPVLARRVRAHADRIAHHKKRVAFGDWNLRRKGPTNFRSNHHEALREEQRRWQVIDSLAGPSPASDGPENSPGQEREKHSIHPKRKKGRRTRRPARRLSGARFWPEIG